ncbi:MAG: helix-turn-helix domain-containing protein [Muribaculaceae bacterium]|nr:helix-turn-helix domain-containing protein [Muribaculaceae bacterium]MDE5844484.1 helix-turn-helix domain-containing protein [Muribaculaceae bacterium]MDE7369425.1 helix-turn-helix domain-containing protein [Muribaculaceae bacterium]
MTKILKVSKPSDYSSLMGQTDPHELISVINYSELSPVPHTLNRYEVYGLFLQGKEIEFDLTYGTGKYDYSDGTLICVAPGQIGGKEDNGELVNLTGWALLFHPDILQGTGLEKEIKNFSFFDYRINEALHMSEEERDIMIGLFKQIKNELTFPADAMQNRIIVGFINLLLRYAQRFYNRQFVSRTITNNDVLTRFENLLKTYFEDEKQLIQGIPTVQFCSEQLNMSSTYFSDIIKRTTGETANHCIKQYVIQLAKNRLVSGMSSSEVAYSLGFDYPQHFSRTFKKITGETPKEYCEQRQASK